MTTAFDELVELVGNRKLPPVHLWNPSNVGEIDISIDENGKWYHDGGEIKRIEMVKLFSTILTRERNDYFLITPVEKLKISVAEAPFLAVDMDYEGEGESRRIVFRTNVDDHVLVDKDHPISIKYRGTEPRPHLLVRNNLHALIARSVFYRLVNDVGEQQGKELVVRSAGAMFSLGRIDEDEAQPG